MNNNFTIVFSLFFAWIERISKRKLFPYILSLILVLLSLFFTKPTFSDFYSKSLAWETVMLKSNDLTNQLQHIDPSNWLSKKVFRISIPVLIKVFHLSPIHVIILQYFINYFLLFFCYHLVLKITKDTVISTLISCGITFIYFGKSGFYDLSYQWFDVFAYFSLILAMYSKSYLSIFFFSTFAAWTDERGFIALSIVFLFHQLEKIKIDSFSIIQFFKLKKSAFFVVLAGFCYLAIRKFLSYKYDMHTPSDGATFKLINYTIPYLKIGMWTFLEGFWILFLFFILQCLIYKKFGILLIIILPIIVISIVSVCVTDITRSGSYMVPIIFVLVGMLYSKSHVNEFRIILLVCFLVTLLFPTVMICPDFEKEKMFPLSFLVWITKHFSFFNF